MRRNLWLIAGVVVFAIAQIVPAAGQVIAANDFAYTGVGFCEGILKIGAQSVAMVTLPLALSPIGGSSTTSETRPCVPIGRPIHCLPRPPHPQEQCPLKDDLLRIDHVPYCIAHHTRTDREALSQ